MGRAIAQGLLAAEYEVIVDNAARKNLQSLVARGAHVAESPAHAICAADATLLVMANIAETHAILRADDVREALDGHALLNATPTTPQEIAELAQYVEAAGGHLAEAKIATNPVSIRGGHGEFILACDQSHTALWRAVLGALGEKIHHVGPVGNASKADMALRLSQLFQTVAVAYSVAAFAKLDLPVNVLQLVLTENATLRIANAGNVIEAMKCRAYPPQLSTVDDMVISSELLLEFAQQLGLPTEVFTVFKGLYRAAAERGQGAQDCAAIYEGIYPEARGPSQSWRS